MRIADVVITPLRLPYLKTYHWAQGTLEAAEVLLVEAKGEDGTTGIGEIMADQSVPGIEIFAKKAVEYLIGRDLTEMTRPLAEAYQGIFQAHGTTSAPRFGAQVLSGLEIALWDLLGRVTGQPLHTLLGGAQHKEIQYFGFPQGDTAEEIADHARTLCEAGHEVIYVKIGRGDALDLEIVRQTREAIGDRRLRLDANEAWDLLTARRMIGRLSKYDPEFIEQPINSLSLAALKSFRASSPVPVAADQKVFNHFDLFDVCQAEAADLIVLGLHETGGPSGFKKAAAVAEAAGLNVCLHGIYETGITTAAANHVGASISNLDDGNQYMNHLLAEDIVAAPDLNLNEGRLPVLDGPGIGVTLDADAVQRAAGRYLDSHKR